MNTDPSARLADKRWARLEELFSQAIELPPVQRAAFITRETAEDAALRRELLELLECDSGKSTGPLTNALGAAIDATARDRRKAYIGRIIGNYKLVSVLGQGGTGTVYLGERADRQYSAQVAVKIVDSATIGDLGMRFRAERQILASLNHANISRLLDAGETPEGQPYLVMEYVHGEPVDRYCDTRQQDLRGRLKLFLEICGAVQYAHQNLIVHRDLKPANILVTPEGSPKLLDFGIAKLLDAGDAPTVLALTRMNDRLLTPEYASPEQILGRNVTTASDVYALGVVLYELLTGLRPYIVPASASQLELERTICIADPTRPSAMIGRAIDHPAGDKPVDIRAIAAARGTTPEKLQKRLQGDLDAIALRALRKEPQHRYSSVEQLAADVRRYLLREPVSARQGNWLYYSQRFVRRHTYGVAAGTLFVALIISFAVAMSVQTRRIAAERDRAELESERAEKVSDFMLTVFSAADPFTHEGREITARELLERSGQQVREDLGQHPEVRARLLESIGRAYRRRGDTDKAISFLEDAVHIRKQMTDNDGSAIIAAMAELAVALRQVGDVEGSDKILRDALQQARSEGLERTPSYAKLLVNRGRLELDASNLPAARRYFEESLDLYREVLGPRDMEVAVVLLELSRLYQWSEDLQSAERAARDAVAIFSVTVAPLHPDRVLAKARLGEVLYLQGRINDASALFVDSLKDQITLFGENSRPVADVRDSLSRILRAQGRIEEAEKYAHAALDSSIAAMGTEHTDTAYYRTALAALLTQLGDYTQAETQLRAALDTFSKLLPPDHQYVASAEHLLGEVLLMTHRLTDAEAMFTASMNRWKRTEAPAWRSARAANGLGEVLYRQGRIIEAERYLTESYSVLAIDENADRDARTVARERMTRFYTDRGQREKLQELILATSRGVTDGSPPAAARN
ncbi:serine/threonine protein kinase [Steroidobacter denitrificans]|uniref:Serine/threonine protein kinase n=1 Tax=Steroidobacter denitrificans TaxID=465721 RepID=A0A127F613_STEDE|nr:serine/threonine-protein kinase [Steroidobacter denitrificans]AMN45873.1 serine/threonine protein kinase [Steroidobacter denitrificans]